MFYYYGSKTLLAKYYPEPKYNFILEPFAGSAAYSIYHLSRNKKIKTFLFENDKRVVETWHKVLSMSEKDIINYPTPNIGEMTGDFLIMTCAVSNAVARCSKLKFTERLARVFEIQKRRLIKALYLKDRIEVVLSDYSETPNIKESTVFIDPPYQITRNVNKKTVFANGNGYGKNSSSDKLDYKQLSDWCRSRLGQTIVCEKAGADWLPFINLKNGKSSMGKNYKEVFWAKE